MDKYIINGKEVQYDTFDLEAMELLDMEIERVAAAAEAVDPAGLSLENYRSIVREQCENVLDAFDTVLGDGTSERLFGGKMNAKTILEAYRKFVGDVMAARANFGNGNDAPAPAPTNREQKRAAEREKRRQEAKNRAKKKGGEHAG